MANGTASGSGNAAAGPSGMSSEREQIIAWTESLARVNITDWFGIISIPNQSLQDMIWQALKDLNCPPSIIERLAYNCHEDRWPEGINSLETRQLYKSKVEYKKYICRQISVKAVVVMYYENIYVPRNYLAKPGFVMAFAYGIECINDSLEEENETSQ